ncbi:MAG: sensor histidine kinase [Lachnospiraceae bacterium]|nr:sensor histidine kinase [Lachnospiraceae bacterium]
MRRLLNRRKALFFKIWISIILISIILFIAVNVIWYKNTSDIIYRNEMQSASSLLYQLNMRIENIFNSININSYPFLFDSDVREMLSVPPADEQARLENEEQIRNIFRQMKKNTTMICSVEFVGRYYNISSEMERSRVDFERLREYDWYLEFSDYYVDLITPVYKNDYIEKYNTRVIGWARKLTGADTANTIGTFLIEISYPSIENVMREAMEKSGNRILVFDKRGNLYFHPDSPQDKSFSAEETDALLQKAKSGEDVFTFTGQRSEYTCLVERSAASGWYIVMMVNRQELLDSTRASVSQSLLLALFIALFSFVIAYALSQYITRPIHQLADTMKMVESNRLDVAVPVDTSVTEAEILSRGFNKMLSHIRELIGDIRREEQEKNAIEIKMLQAQINPHFLYNILNVIRWKAVMHGEETISSMLLSLIRLLEFSGKKTGTFVTIEKELEHASSYINLIRYQYQDDFEIVYDVDPEALSCYTVKFILQPLLENALFHGIEPLDEKGQILLSIRRNEDGICFVIEDNGVGMPEDIQHNLSAFRGLGLFNVCERLKKHYGEQSALQIESQKGAGTRISFQIPVICDPSMERNHNLC